MSGLVDDESDGLRMGDGLIWLAGGLGGGSLIPIPSEAMITETGVVMITEAGVIMVTEAA